MSERLRPWLPAGLAHHGFTHETVRTLSYLFFDELVDDTVAFLVQPWPSADELGRLRFDAADEQLEFALGLDRVQQELYRRFRRRAPRPGDTFAAVIRSEALRALRDGSAVVGITDAVDGAVYDLSTEARLVAKLAYYASLAAVVPDQKARTWGLPQSDSAIARPAPARDMGARS